jgi:hypothetical protein
MCEISTSQGNGVLLKKDNVISPELADFICEKFETLKQDMHQKFIFARLKVHGNEVELPLNSCKESNLDEVKY